MPTNNEWNNSTIPITIAKGGTNSSTLTANRILAGDGVSSPTSLPIGSATQILVSNGAAVDPIFSTNTYPATTASGTVLLCNTNNAITAGSVANIASFTFGAAAFIGATETVIVSNTDNTNTSSNAHFKSMVGGTSAGDADYVFTNSIQQWAVSLDNSDNDNFAMGSSAVAPTTYVYRILLSGERTAEKTVSFLAYKSATVNNITGDGTNYTVVNGVKIFDQNTDYSIATGMCTAPVSGKYLFCTSTLGGGFTVGMTDGISYINTSNRTYAGNNQNYYALSGAAVYRNVQQAALADMDAGDTAYPSFKVSGGLKVVDIYGNANAPTYFSGELIC